MYSEAGTRRSDPTPFASPPAGLIERWPFTNAVVSVCFGATFAGSRPYDKRPLPLPAALVSLIVGRDHPAHVDRALPFSEGRNTAMPALDSTPASGSVASQEDGRSPAAHGGGVHGYRAETALPANATNAAHLSYGKMSCRYGQCRDASQASLFGDTIRRIERELGATVAGPTLPGKEGPRYVDKGTLSE